jgi:hypothetical protein
MSNVLTSFSDYVLYVFFALYSLVLCARIGSHMHSRYLQHLERMDGQVDPSISSGVHSNIPSIISP